MGKLGNQLPRCGYKISNSDILRTVNMLLMLKRDSDDDIELSDVIQIWKTLEYRRRTSIIKDDGDYKDEQMGGFAELFDILIKELKK